MLAIFNAVCVCVCANFMYVYVLTLFIFLHVAVQLISENLPSTIFFPVIHFPSSTFDIFTVFILFFNHNSIMTGHIKA